MQALSFRGIWGAVHAKIIGRKFFHDVGVLTAANLVGAAFSLIKGILVARWLGPELYGIVALVMSYPGVVFAFFDARSSEASVKYLGEFHSRGERNQVLALCKLGYAVDFAVAALAFATVLVTANWAAVRIAHRPEAAGLMIVYSAAFLSRSLDGTSYAVLATLKRFPTIAWVRSVTNLVNDVLVVGFVLSGYQVAGVIWGSAIGMVITGLVYGVTAHSLIHRTWGASWFYGALSALTGRGREIFWFLTNSNLNALLGMVSKQLDVAILGYFRTPTEVGYYKVGKSLAGKVGYVSGPLQSVSYPELVRLWSLGDGLAFRRKLKRLAWFIGLPLGLVTLLGVAVLRQLIELLVGKAYLPAVFAAQLLFASTAWQSVFFWLRPAYMASDSIRAWVIIASIFTCTLMVTWIFVVPAWGYVGVAASLLVIGIFHDSYCTLFLSRQMREHYGLDG